MRAALMVVFVVGCESGKPEQSAKDPVAEVRIDSADGRRAFAAELSVGDVVVRAAGPDATIFEIGSAAGGCMKEDPIRNANKHRATFVIRGFTSVRCLDGSHEVTVKGAPYPLPAPNPVELRASAGEIVDDYAADAGAADAKYLSKPIRVGAVVLRVSKSSRSVELMTLANYKFVAVFRDDAGLSKLKRDDEIEIRCTGAKTDGLPSLSDCTFESGSNSAQP